MTEINYFDIVSSRRKADRKVQGKEGIQMNTNMIFSYLESEHYEEALSYEQGVVFMYTFLRERNHMSQKKTGDYNCLC